MLYFNHVKSIPHNLYLFFMFFSLSFLYSFIQIRCIFIQYNFALRKAKCRPNTPILQQGTHSPSSERLRLSWQIRGALRGDFPEDRYLINLFLFLNGFLYPPLQPYLKPPLLMKLVSFFFREIRQCTQTVPWIFGSRQLYHKLRR